MATQSTLPSIRQLMPVFSKFLSRSVLQQILQEECRQRMYWRLLTPMVVLWGFVFQRLNRDHTCDHFVAHLHAGGVDNLDPDDPHAVALSQRIRSESTAAYVQGRNRLPLKLLNSARQVVQREIMRQLGAAGRWKGYAVRLLDGTVFRLRPYGDLTATYGRSSNQYGPGYWVMVRAVAAFDLFSQAVVGVADGPETTSETQLVGAVLAEDEAENTLYVGDRNFGVYTVVQALQATGHACLLRLTHSRAAALLRRNKQRSLRPGLDCLVTWTPSPADQVLQHLPPITVDGRLCYAKLTKPGFRPIHLLLFTTLTDPVRFPLDDLVALYGHRWQVEVDLRHVKTTLGMAHIDVRSTLLFRKELAAGLLAYTLVCAFMSAAAQRAQLRPVQLSFSRCLRRVSQALFFTPLSTENPQQQLHRLLRRLARCRLPHQPNKAPFEPRRKRRLPRPYPPLKGDRQAAREAARQKLLIS